MITTYTQPASSAVRIARAGNPIAWSGAPSLNTAIGALDGNYCNTPAIAAGIMNAGSVSEYLGMGGFGFALPAGTVLGVQFDVYDLEAVTGMQGRVSDETASLVFAGAPGGANKAIAGTWSTVLMHRVYGGPADLWGFSSIDRATINSDATFALALAVRVQGLFSYNGVQTTIPATAGVDYCTCTVYMSDAGPVPTPNEIKPGDPNILVMI